MPRYCRKCCTPGACQGAHHHLQPTRTRPAVPEATRRTNPKCRPPRRPSITSAARGAAARVRDSLSSGTAAGAASSRRRVTSSGARHLAQLRGASRRQPRQRARKAVPESSVTAPSSAPPLCAAAPAAAAVKSNRAVTSPSKRTSRAPPSASSATRCMPGRADICAPGGAYFSVLWLLWVCAWKQLQNLTNRCGVEYRRWPACEMGPCEGACCTPSTAAAN